MIHAILYLTLNYYEFNFVQCNYCGVVDWIWEINIHCWQIKKDRIILFLIKIVSHDFYIFYKLFGHIYYKLFLYFL